MTDCWVTNPWPENSHDLQIFTWRTGANISRPKKIQNCRKKNIRQTPELASTFLDLKRQNNLHYGKGQNFVANFFFNVDKKSGYCPPQLKCKDWAKYDFILLSLLLSCGKPLCITLLLCITYIYVMLCYVVFNVRNGQNIAANFSLLPGSRPWGVCWLRLGLEPFTLPQLLLLLLLLTLPTKYLHTWEWQSCCFSVLW